MPWTGTGATLRVPSPILGQDQASGCAVLDAVAARTPLCNGLSLLFSLPPPL